MGPFAPGDLVTVEARFLSPDVEGYDPAALRVVLAPLADPVLSPDGFATRTARPSVFVAEAGVEPCVIPVEAGYYTFSFIITDPGSYEVRFEATGLHEQAVIDQFAVIVPDGQEPPPPTPPQPVIPNDAAPRISAVFTQGGVHVDPPTVVFRLIAPDLPRQYVYPNDPELTRAEQGVYQWQDALRAVGDYQYEFVGTPSDPETETQAGQFTVVRLTNEVTPQGSA